MNEANENAQTPHNNKYLKYTQVAIITDKFHAVGEQFNQSSLRSPFANVIKYRGIVLPLYYRQTFFSAGHHYIPMSGARAAFSCSQVGRRIKSMSKRSDLIEMPVPRLRCPIFTLTRCLSVAAASSRILASRRGSTATVGG